MTDTNSPLHLIKVPLRYEKLIGVARRRGIPLRELDDGYLAHCVLKEIWQDHAPAPFVPRYRGVAMDVWGYSATEAAILADHARTFADPELLAAIDGVDQIVSKPMPTLMPERRVGFHLRASPVVRLSKARGNYRAGAELDAYQARCLVDDEAAPPREQVYREWLKQRLDDSATTGVSVSHVSLAACSRERLVRRTQGSKREAKQLDRPIACFEGELVIKDGARFHELLRRGVGRHRGFGFGALIVVPSGTPYPRR